MAGSTTQVGLTQALGAMNRRPFPLLALIFLTSCTTTPAQLRNIPLATKPTIPRTETECSAAGQHWVRQDNFSLEASGKSCAVQTSDGRKICTNSDQCQGTCLVDNALPIGRPAIGSCSDWAATFGCHKLLENGLVAAICTD